MVQRIGEQLAPSIALGGHGHQLAVRQISNAEHPYTVDQDDQQLWVDSSVGVVTLTLEDPANATHQILMIVVVDATNTITLTPAAGLIDGAASITITASRIISCDGSAWRTVSAYIPVAATIQRNVAGLFDSDDFNRADGAHGAGWTTFLGVAPTIVSNELQGTPTGADITTIKNQPSLLDTMLIQSFCRSGDSSVPIALAGKWVDATGGYMLQLATFQNLLRIFVWNGASFTLVSASGSITINDNDEWDVQFFLADSVQDGWAQKRTAGPIATVAGTNGGYTGTGEAGVRTGTGTSVSAEWDDFMVMRDKDVLMTNLPTGWKAKIRDTGGLVVAEATESSGTATIDASMAGTATEIVPFVGWADIIVTDAADAIRGAYDLNGIYPGDQFQWL